MSVYHQDDLVTIHHANALNLPVEDSSVDLVVTSPPYFGLRSYTDEGQHYDGQIGDEATPAEFVDALIAATREMVRVLKPTGSIFVNLGDKYQSSPSGPAGRTAVVSETQKHRNAQNGRRSLSATIPSKSLMGIPWRYALRCIDDLGLILRAEIIWAKPNGLPESVTDRVRRSHEQWFHFTLKPRYYSAVDEVREHYAEGGTAARYAARCSVLDTERAQLTKGYTASDGGPTYVNPLGKIPGSVWTIPTQSLIIPEHLGVDHFAAFPMEWPRRIIRGWLPPASVILDPFGGTGTTALVAKALGRRAIHVDLSRDYCRLAKWRVTDPKQLAQAAELNYTPPSAQAPGQAELLFDDGGF